MTEDSETRLPLGPQVPYYVFFLPNVFEPTTHFPIPERISISEAERICRYLFRMDEAKSDIPSKTAAEESYVGSFVKARLATLGPETSRQEFVLLCVGMLVWLMEWLLQLKLTLIWTSDKTEIVCLIGASDPSYARMANIQQLRFRLRTDLDSDHDFKKVSPSTLLSRVLHPNRDLQHYTEDNLGSGTPTSSIFSQLSRLTLLTNHFDRAIFIDAWVKLGLITTHFSLHDNTALERLTSDWKLHTMLDSKVTRDIRRYFGELLTLYFAWLSHLLLWLIVPAVLGTGVWLLALIGHLGYATVYEQAVHIAFTALMAIWAALQGKFWIRREKDFSWRWALYKNWLKETDQLDDGEVRVWDPVTARMRKPRYEGKRTTKLVLSYALTFLFLSLYLLLLCLLYHFDRHLSINHTSYDFTGVLIGLIIYLGNFTYDKVAYLLTLWEDYGTVTEFKEAVCGKMYLFRLIACYGPVIYVAFVKAAVQTCDQNDCLGELNWLLFGLFAFQFCAKVLEIVKSVISHYFTHREMLHKVKESAPSYEKERYLSSKVVSYSTYADEMMNYGYAALFAAGCPIVPLLVAVLLAIQTKFDVLRLTKLTRRPNPASYSSWRGSNDLIGLIAVLAAITNPGIVLFSSPYFTEFSGEWKLFLFVAVEHGLLLMKSLLGNAIKDEAESEV